MNEQQDSMGKVIARALQDEAFKRRLIADPAAVLKAAGVAVPEGITLKVVADTESERHIVLPASSGQLSDAEIAGVTAAGCAGGSCGRGPAWRAGAWGRWP